MNKKNFISVKRDCSTDYHSECRERESSLSKERFFIKFVVQPFLFSIFFFFLYLPQHLFAIEIETNNHSYISSENIAFINMSKLYEYSIEFKNIKNKLEDKKKAAYKKIDNIEKKIIYKKEIKEKKNLLTSIELKTLNEEISFLEDELKNLLYDQKNELIGYQKEISKKILLAIYLEIRKHARKEKIQIVIDKSKNIYWKATKNDLDITDTILKKLEKSSRTFSIN